MNGSLKGTYSPSLAIIPRPSWVVTVRKDFEQRGVGDEIETGEHLLLGFEILVKSFLARVYFVHQLVEKSFTALSAGALSNFWFVLGISHELLEVLIDLLESLGLIGQGIPDIVGLQEDWLEFQVVFLNFYPLADDCVDGFEGLNPFGDFFSEFFDVLRALHTHQVEGMCVYILSNLIERSEEWNSIFSRVEREDLVFPNGLDAIEFLVNLVFLLSTVDQFRNIFTDLKELKLNQVSKAEFIGLKRNRLLDDFGLKASPVAFKHEWRMELGNQRQNRVHVLDTFI